MFYWFNFLCHFCRRMFANLFYFSTFLDTTKSLLLCNEFINFLCYNSRECLNNSRQKSLIDEHKILFAQISTHHISSVGYKLMSICIILFYLFSGGMEEIKIFSNNISNLIRVIKNTTKNESDFWSLHNTELHIRREMSLRVFFSCSCFSCVGGWLL